MTYQDFSTTLQTLNQDRREAIEQAREATDPCERRDWFNLARHIGNEIKAVVASADPIFQVRYMRGY